MSSSAVEGEEMAKKFLVPVVAVVDLLRLLLLVDEDAEDRRPFLRGRLSREVKEEFNSSLPGVFHLLGPNGAGLNEWLPSEVKENLGWGWSSSSSFPVASMSSSGAATTSCDIICFQSKRKNEAF